MPHENPSDEALFDLPDDARVPLRRVVVLAGASGSGKSSIAHRLGVPVVHLDDFYLDHDHPELPRRHGIVDWDSPRTWDAEAAVAALLTACRGDRLEVPTYDIPTSRRTGMETIDIAGAPAVVAEGIFAAEVVEPLRAEGVLAGAYYLDQSRFTTAVRRFARDVGESRKPLPALVRRGTSLMLAEPGLVAGWRAGGLEALPTTTAEARLRALTSTPA
ncbi:ATP-binding protein [Serinibacter arcticus]|uniref:ATP-binding protein n=1 Tax=Serinibacter arcticus TaxID=1655435 RepID=A0A2U1ZY52_9MICO|nr:ATP-binding protein [Serinibacter arcticus]PWD51870.1 ATP-binding protein [Serinibacter arcticus]